MWQQDTINNGLSTQALDAAALQGVIVSSQTDFSEKERKRKSNKTHTFKGEHHAFLTRPSLHCLSGCITSSCTDATNPSVQLRNTDRDKTKKKKKFLSKFASTCKIIHSQDEQTKKSKKKHTHTQVALNHKLRVWGCVSKGCRNPLCLACGLQRISKHKTCSFWTEQAELKVKILHCFFCLAERSTLCFRF